MSRALTRLATALVAACGLIAGGLALPASAATPVPPENIIVIPGPDQVDHIIDGNRCPWMITMTAALSGGQTAPSPLAMLVLGPMVAASYSGMLEG